jgi:hypothetical protein
LTDLSTSSQLEAALETERSRNAALQSRVSELESRATLPPSSEAETAKCENGAAVAKTYLVVEELFGYLSGVVKGHAVDVAQLQSFELRALQIMQETRDVQRMQSDAIIRQSDAIARIDANVSMLVGALQKQGMVIALMRPQLELVKEAE